MGGVVSAAVEEALRGGQGKDEAAGIIDNAAAELILRPDASMALLRAGQASGSGPDAAGSLTRSEEDEELKMAELTHVQHVSARLGHVDALRSHYVATRRLQLASDLGRDGVLRAAARALGGDAEASGDDQKADAEALLGGGYVPYLEAMVGNLVLDLCVSKVSMPPRGSDAVWLRRSVVPRAGLFRCHLECLTGAIDSRSLMLKPRNVGLTSCF